MCAFRYLDFFLCCLPKGCLTPLRSGLGVEWGVGRQEKRMKGELGLVCKMKKNFLIKENRMLSPLSYIRADLAQKTVPPIMGGSSQFSQDNPLTDMPAGQLNLDNPPWRAGVKANHCSFFTPDCDKISNKATCQRNLSQLTVSICHRTEGKSKSVAPGACGRRSSHLDG